MLRPTKLAAAITTASVAFVGPALATGTAAHAVTPEKSGNPTITVNMTSKGFTLPEEVHAGFVKFAVSTPDPNEHQLQGIQLHKGVKLSQFVADIHKATNHNPAISAAGIRQTERDVTAVGGAFVSAGSAVDATIPLTRGTYWFVDFTQFFVPGAKPVFHRLEVNGEFEGTAPTASAEISQVETKAGPRFESTGRLDDGDTYRVNNDAGELHELEFVRVKKGVNDHDLSLFFAGKLGFNPLAEKAGRGASAQSPGRFMFIRFHVKPGHYTMLCFIPDNKSGIPHAFLGMHKVVAIN